MFLLNLQELLGTKLGNGESFFAQCTADLRVYMRLTGCCKSLIQFEKLVYLPKPALNLLKTWFSREKPTEMTQNLFFARPDL
jgi:hypothetical protein